MLRAGGGTGGSSGQLCHSGHSNALARLREAATAARGGWAGGVLVTGVAGIGKTALLNRARAELARHQGTILHATGRPSAAPGDTVRELFAPLGLTTLEAATSPLLDGQARWALPALRPGSEPIRDERRVLSGLYRLVANLMTEEPLTIMLDDAQHCDPLVLRLVEFLLRRASHQPAFVVLAGEPGAAGCGRELLDVIAGDGALSAIELGLLSEGEVAEAVALAQGAEPEPAFVRVCAELSGGHPAALRTLLAALGERGVRPDGPGAEQAAEIGARVLADALPARLDRLPDRVRRVAAGFALLGATEPWAVAALLELPAAAVFDAVDDLRRHGLLPADRLEFALDQAGAAILGGLPPAELGVLRRRGALLLHDDGRPAEEVARLLVDLPELDEPWMVSTLREAATDARRRGALDTAERLLNRFAQTVPDHPETLLELAMMQSDLDPDAAVAHLLRAIRHTDDLQSRAMLVSSFGVLALRARKAALAFRLLSGLLDKLDAGPAEVSAVDDLRNGGQAVLLGVGLRCRSTVRESLRRARAMSAPAGDTPNERLILGMLAGTAMLDGGSAEKAAGYARTAVSGSLVIHSGSLILAARTLDRAGLPEESLAALDRIVADTRAAGHRWAHCHALATRSTVATGVGRPADAEADALAAMELAAQEDWPYPRIAFAALLVDRGQLERAEATLAGVRPPDSILEYCAMLMAQARLRSALGDLEGALPLLWQCGQAMAQAGVHSAVLAPWWLDVTVILAIQERWAEALALVEEHEDAIARWGTAEAIGLGLVARGVATSGRRGVNLVTEGVECLAASPARINHLYSEVFLGKRLLLAGDAAGARKYLRRAVELAVRCGCSLLGERVKGLLVAAGGWCRKPSGGASDLLTAAEWRVVEQVASGATNREISERLFITVRTVETHLSNVYRKLGVTSRAKIGPALRKLFVTEPGTGQLAIAGMSAERLG